MDLEECVRDYTLKTRDTDFWRFVSVSLQECVRECTLETRETLGDSCQSTFKSVWECVLGRLVSVSLQCGVVAWWFTLTRGSPRPRAVMLTGWLEAIQVHFSAVFLQVVAVRSEGKGRRQKLAFKIWCFWYSDVWLVSWLVCLMWFVWWFADQLSSWSLGYMVGCLCDRLVGRLIN